MYWCGFRYKHQLPIRGLPGGTVLRATCDHSRSPPAAGRQRRPFPTLASQVAYTTPPAHPAPLCSAACWSTSLPIKPGAALRHQQPVDVALCCYCPALRVASNNFSVALCMHASCLVIALSVAVQDTVRHVDLMQVLVPSSFQGHETPCLIHPQP